MPSSTWCFVGFELQGTTAPATSPIAPIASQFIKLSGCKQRAKVNPASCVCVCGLLGRSTHLPAGPRMPALEECSFKRRDLEISRTAINSGPPSLEATFLSCAFSVNTRALQSLTSQPLESGQDVFVLWISLQEPAVDLDRWQVFPKIDVGLGKHPLSTIR